MCWMISLLRVHPTFYRPDCPALYYYEVLLAELLGGKVSLRQAFDHGQEEWVGCQRIHGYPNQGEVRISPYLPFHNLP